MFLPTLVGDREVGGLNPLAPTTNLTPIDSQIRVHRIATGLRTPFASGLLVMRLNSFRDSSSHNLT
jgi:hypothetical protein